MANYALIKVAVCKPKATKQTRIEQFEPVLKACVFKTLDKRWEVKLADFDYDGITWLVTIPGTATTDLAAARKMLAAPGEDVGFMVALQPKAIAFRHGMNMFTGWAQGRVEEELSDHYEKGIFFDATDRTQKVGTREYRLGKTFRQYLLRNFDKPLSDEDEKYIDSFRRLVPDGHW